MHAHDSAAGDGEPLALHVLVGLDRVDVLVDLVDLEPHAQRRQRGRFHQPDVADGTVVDAAVELLLVQAGADLPLQLQPAGARVHDPPRLHTIDAPHHVAERRRKAVEDETGIHARPQERHLAPLGDAVETLGDLRMPQPRVRELLAGGDHREAGGQRLRKLVLHAVQPAPGGVQQDAVLRLLQRRSGVGSHDHVGSWRIDHVGQLASDPLRIEIDGGDDFQIGPGEHGSGDESPDGAEPHQNDLRCHASVLRTRTPYTARWPAYSPTSDGPYSAKRRVTISWTPYAGRQAAGWSRTGLASDELSITCRSDERLVLCAADALPPLRRGSPGGGCRLRGLRPIRPPEGARWVCVCRR